MQAVTATITPHHTPAPLTRRGDFDARGCRVSGANVHAIDHFEAALASFQAWRGGAEVPLVRALQEAPAFVMAHVLEAYLLLCSRDVRRVRQARQALEDALRLAPRPLLRRERLHLAAITAVLDDDYHGAKALLGAVLRQEPRDVLALQAAHALDYLTGDLARLGDRVAGVLPAWSPRLPGHHAVLAMHAFSLVEGGEVARAEEAARAALVLNPLDARAHHAMAHVFETSGRFAAGERWMDRHAEAWGPGSTVATHCAWHVALFHVAEGHLNRALELYDRHARANAAPELADLIDASALLWRVQLRGGTVGTRWRGLADAWAAHIDDAFCSFSDVHAMLAFVGAQHWGRARHLEHNLVAAHSRATRYGATTRALGLPAARALIAFGRGERRLAITLLASLPASVHRLGGSHAQRDVLHLTLQQAVENIRRPMRRQALRHVFGAEPQVAAAAS